MREPSSMRSGSEESGRRTAYGKTLCPVLLIFRPHTYVGLLWKSAYFLGKMEPMKLTNRAFTANIYWGKELRLHRER